MRQGEINRGKCVLGKDNEEYVVKFGALYTYWENPMGTHAWFDLSIYGPTVWLSLG